MRKFKSHPYYNVEGEIGDASVSVETPDESGSEGNAPAQEQQAENETKAGSETSFAKRLREHSEKEVKNAREAWEKETGDKYKDYDTHKQLSEYFQKINNADALSLKERVEMEKLQERADQANVPPEVMKRLDELEAKAAKADELEQKQQQNEAKTNYFSTLNEFVKDKGVEAEALNQYMIDNGITYLPEDMAKSFNVALRAMRADQVDADKAAFEANKEQFKKDTLKEYLDSKKAPKAEGKGAAGIQGQGAPGSWKNADARALERIRSANNTV